MQQQVNCERVAEGARVDLKGRPADLRHGRIDVAVDHLALHGKEALVLAKTPGVEVAESGRGAGHRRSARNV